MKKSLLPAIIIAMVLIPLMACSQTAEFRSMESTAWGSGFESPSATTAFVNYVRSCNMNALIPELRLRCDAYYDSNYEPPGTGVAPAYGYDSLADLITKAHAVGMEVHPWFVTFRIWTTDAGAPHTTPEHIWWTHGPGNTNPAEDWCMRGDTGGWSYGGISNLDPGHPAVEDYLITVFMDMVSRYDVDGLNLDYIRYPSTSWGYNPVAVARYNAEYGTTGNPSASNANWMNWRRDQVSNLVKRLYLEIKAIKPWVKLNIDGWNSASTGNASYFQDWDKWMTNHWLDFTHPMSYTSSNSTYNGWLDTYLGNQHGRHVYPLIDASNDINGNVIPQIDNVRAHGFQGLGLYAYNTIPNRTALRDALVAGPFPTFVSPPGMSWLDTPTKGHIKGFVRNGGGNAIYPVTVTIIGPGTSSKNTGTGFYGFVDVTPGDYTVRAQAGGYTTVDMPVTVTAGAVTTQDFTLVGETTPPVITNVRATNVQATNVLIQWDTDEGSTSQVDYGLTTSYGTTTTEDMAQVTAHAVQLVSLIPSTTYHYRVRSYDAIRNVAVSTDYQFTTGPNDTPADIIIDNTDAGCSVVGGWLTSSSAGDKYGSNYFYCSPAVGGKVATWRPNIIVAGNYDVYAWWPAGGNRTTRAPYIVYWNGGSETIPTNQQVNGGSWQLIKSNVPFALGTAGKVTVSNAGIEVGWNVMADAIKFAYHIVDVTPPSAPTNLAATANALGQMSLTWTASTDNIGVTGYNVFRDTVQVATPSTNSFGDTGLVANTQYSYYVKAHDGAGNLSSASTTVAKYSLSVAPGAGSLTCDKTVNTWQTTPDFAFTAVGGFGAGKVEYYKYAWTQSSTYTWTGFEGQWTSGNLTPQATTGGSWYLHVKGCNGNGVENGAYSYGPYKYDDTAPSVTDLNDGKYVASGGQLSASWTGSDSQSGITEYQYAVGTAPDNVGSVVVWTSTNTTASATTVGLTLAANQMYYFGVKAKNGAGVWCDPVISDGVTGATVVSSIVAAKGLADDQAIMLSDKVVSGSFGTFFYICEDNTGGKISAIRVEGASGFEGNLNDVSGILDTINGERAITAPDTSPVAGPGAPTPVLINNKYLGGGDLNAYTLGITNGIGVNNVGMLLTIIGKVVSPGLGYFMVDDGSKQIKVSTLMLGPVPGVDKMVRVTGIVSTEESGGIVTPVLIPRADSDVPEPWY